jgi:hypothetical protein
MARVIKPPAPLQLADGEPAVFLVGSIEMGHAEDWQAAAERALADLDLVILNPRRDTWDTSWVQSIENAQFREQVEWELDAQESATVIAMYFAPTTKAPVTLLELGLFARTGKVVVCCPQGYWRRGNVEIVCQRCTVPLVSELAELFKLVRERVLRHRPIDRLLKGYSQAETPK